MRAVEAGKLNGNVRIKAYTKLMEQWMCVKERRKALLKAQKETYRKSL